MVPRHIRNAKPLMTEQGAQNDPFPGQSDRANYYARAQEARRKPAQMGGQSETDLRAWESQMDSGASSNYQNPFQGLGILAGNPGDRFQAMASQVGAGPSGGMLGFLPAGMTRSGSQSSINEALGQFAGGMGGGMQAGPYNPSEQEAARQSVSQGYGIPGLNYTGPRGPQGAPDPYASPAPSAAPEPVMQGRPIRSGPMRAAREEGRRGGRFMP